MLKSDEIKELKLQFPKITRYEAGEEIELTGEEYEIHIEDLWQLNKKREEIKLVESKKEEAKLIAQAKLNNLGLTTEDIKLLLS